MILIVDFGSQYTQLIARRIRELNVYSAIVSCDAPRQGYEGPVPEGIILSGGPETASAIGAPKIADWLFEFGCPILGICYGMQALAHHFGGEVVTALQQEFGFARLEHLQASPLFPAHFGQADDNTQSVWMSHGDHVTQLPSGFHCLAKTNNTPYAAIADETRKIYGLQFHPEVTHTAGGKEIFAAFVHAICHCKPNWTTQQVLEQQLEEVKTLVGDDRVLLGLSGGVDSSVVAALLQRAIGKQLTAIFIDTGLLRKNEAKEVLETFKSHFSTEIVHVDASERFFNELSGLDDPEAKRKCAGRVFIELFEEQLRHYPDAKWLAQGTIYPDVVESAKTKYGKAKVIKSHHNVGGLPEKFNLKLLEPLRELFKDEVRALGKTLGVPDAIINRHPFPGPGLAIRILGEVTQKKADCLREVDAIFIDELRKQGYYEKVSQAFAVFLPVNSVGVTGDGRRYEPVVALRAVVTTDFMTAEWAPLPHEFLGHVSNRIVNEVPGISRVVYDISGKPPATIEWE